MEFGNYYISCIITYGLWIDVTAAPVMAQDNNMTMGGNMTGGNMTDANITQTGSISGCGNECFWQSIVKIAEVVTRVDLQE